MLGHSLYACLMVEELELFFLLEWKVVKGIARLGGNVTKR